MVEVQQSICPLDPGRLQSIRKPGQREEDFSFALLTNPLVASSQVMKAPLVRAGGAHYLSRSSAAAMPPRKSNTLTEAELRLMKMLWARGESAVSDLVAAMPEGEALAYTSVLTTVRILEQKGYVTHRQEGRAFLYSPCVEEHEASRSEIRHMLNRFFGNSRERLLLSLLGDDDIDPEELQRLKDAIAKAAEDAPRESAKNQSSGGKAELQ
jgi:predicted transcriptional regulator